MNTKNITPERYIDYLLKRIEDLDKMNLELTKKLDRAHAAVKLLTDRNNNILQHNNVLKSKIYVIEREKIEE